MDKSNLVTLIVAILSFFAAMAAQRQSAKAAKRDSEAAISTAQISSRADMETDAYVRARAMDTETIMRQATELKEMREKFNEMSRKYDDLDKRYDELEDKYEDLLDEKTRLERRIEDLERHERDTHE